MTTVSLEPAVLDWVSVAGLQPTLTLTYEDANGTPLALETIDEQLVAYLVEKPKK